jgi:hypothetical protein
MVDAYVDGCKDVGLCRRKEDTMDRNAKKDAVNKKTAEQ